MTDIGGGLRSRDTAICAMPDMQVIALGFGFRAVARMVSRLCTNWGEGMNNREAKIRGIAAGDIFHAEAPNGASLICLALDVSKEHIEARVVTTQHVYQFDRKSGIAEAGEDRVPCEIDSVTHLPLRIHNLMLSIDQKYEGRPAIGDLKLSRVQIDALVFVYSFYPNNPLPPAIAGATPTSET